MDWRVCAFTDTYLPTVNGVTYTVKSWRDHINRNGGRMEVVYPSANAYDPRDGEYPVSSVPFPFYRGFRLGVPSCPTALNGADVVHAHTPFSLGLAALRFVRGTDRPLIASFHTPASEYTSYLAPVEALAGSLARISKRYERWFFEKADMVVAPSRSAARYLTTDLGVDTPVMIVPNGVDLDRFRPVDTASFRERHDLPDGPIIGYTGRHGYEKRLEDLIDAVAEGPEEWSIVLGGDGPAAADLKARADRRDVDATFLGFLDREELPAFYSTLDVFAFPSPVETQGLVALESMACGTPVVGVDAGALSETIEAGTTGYHFAAGDHEDFVGAIEQALAERDDLTDGCLDRRDNIGLQQSISALDRVYERAVATDSGT